MADKRDYYEVLGIDKSASADEIKKSYRRLAKKYHPDINKEPGAEERFKEINEAYEILSDPNKKSTYDQYGFAGLENGGGFSGFGDMGGFSGFGDIFESFMGGGFSNFGFNSSRRSNSPMQGDNRYSELTIDFLDAVHGVDKTISVTYDKTCTHCNGSGAKSPSDIRSCPNCKGTGRVAKQVRTPFGIMQQVVECPECHGSGKQITNKCPHCNGNGYNRETEKVDVSIPAGISDSQQIRISGYGERGVNGGPNGDLYIQINVRSHKYFTREGTNIFVTVPISSVDATLGCTIDVPTCYGDVELEIPAGTQPNKKFRLKGQGVKNLRNDSRGDQYVEIKVEIPTKLTKEEKELYSKLSNKAAKKESVFEKFKRSFK